MSDTSLNLYRKLLNLNNLSDIRYIFDNKPFLDIIYDKYRFNPDTNKYYIDETDSKLEVSKELELDWVKEYANDVYDLYTSLFDNSVKYTETTKTLSAGDVIYVHGFIDSDNDGNYTIDSINTNDLIIDETVPDHDGTFIVEKDGFQFTAVLSDSGTSTITLQDINQPNYIYINETDEELFNRLAATETYRKMFLYYLPEFQYLKGTVTYIYYIMKFYYLIKYYDVSLSSAENEAIAENGCVITEDSSQVDTNFVYQIKGLITVSEWELYVKPVVHPHGWIDMYVQDQVIPYTYIQKDNPVMVNGICYCDILTTTQNTVLNNLCNIDRYGNVEMENFKYVYGCDCGTMNFGGIFNYEVFNGYNGIVKESKIISYDSTYPKLTPPIFSMEGYAGTTATLLNTIYTHPVPIATQIIYNYGSYNLSDLLVDEFVDPWIEGETTLLSEVPGTTNSVGSSNEKIYIQTILFAVDNVTVLAKSDIVSFNIQYSSNNPVNPDPVIPVPVPPSPK